MADEYTPEGRRIVPLEPSSPVDPRTALPDDERKVRVRKLANGTTVTTYHDPPLASEYTANKPDPDEYEAFLDQVIAEVDAEIEAAGDEPPGRPLGRNNLRALLADHKSATDET